MFSVLFATSLFILGISGSLNSGFSSADPLARFFADLRRRELPKAKSMNCVVRYTDKQVAEMDAGFPMSRKIWHDGLNLQLDPAFSQSQIEIIMNAAAEIDSNICVPVRAVPARGRLAMAVGDRVIVKAGETGSGCWSYIGKIGGAQELNLEPGCVHHDIVLHELIHALGYNHEQSRPDRDNYVTVLWQNIVPRFQNQFEKDEGFPIFGLPYDYKSIMHYGPLDFSSNGKATMMAKNGQSLGAMGSLTVYDREKIRRLYNC